MGDSDESDVDDTLDIKANPTFELLKKCTSAWQQFSAKRKMTHELKEYQELFLTELPGSTKVTSAATHAVLEGELDEDESSKKVVPRFRDRTSGPSPGDKKKVGKQLQWPLGMNVAFKNSSFCIDQKDKE